MCSLSYFEELMKKDAGEERRWDEGMTTKDLEDKENSGELTPHKP